MAVLKAGGAEGRGHFSIFHLIKDTILNSLAGLFIKVKFTDVNTGQSSIYWMDTLRVNTGKQEPSTWA